MDYVLQCGETAQKSIHYNDAEDDDVQNLATAAGMTRR